MLFMDDFCSLCILSTANFAETMTPLLLSETKQHNFELRMAVNKVSDKVDKIMEKVVYCFHVLFKCFFLHCLYCVV